MASGWGRTDDASPFFAMRLRRMFLARPFPVSPSAGCVVKRSLGERLKILEPAELVTLHLRYEFEMLGETRLRRFKASTRKPAQSSGSCCALGQLSLSALSPGAASF